MLLADVFENFNNKCFEHYGLDPFHYFNSPGLSWDPVLKMSGIEIELISNIDMYLFIGKVLRGGISYIFKIHRKTSNKCMESYDDKKPSKYITYLDANNLYGWMS